MKFSFFWIFVKYICALSRNTLFWNFLLWISKSIRILFIYIMLPVHIIYADSHLWITPANFLAYTSQFLLSFPFYSIFFEMLT